MVFKACNICSLARCRKCLLDPVLDHRKNNQIQFIFEKKHLEISASVILDLRGSLLSPPSLPRPLLLLVARSVASLSDHTAQVGLVVF